MNAPFSPPDEIAPKNWWTNAISETCEWRGHCQDVLAQVEKAVTDTLRALTSSSASACKLDHLVGKRFRELEDVLQGASGTRARNRALAGLKAFAEHRELRTMLCHGVLEVLRAKDGEWFLLLRRPPVGDCKAEPALLRSREDAEQMLQKLRRDSQSLIDRLRVLRGSLAVT